MSRDRRGDGVQVVAGSKPACPTKPNPFPQNNIGCSAKIADENRMRSESRATTLPRSLMLPLPSGSTALRSAPACCDTRGMFDA